MMVQASSHGVSLRLRQAILSNDIALVERLLRADPYLLHNPDFNDKSNTSLHLAAQAGHTELAELLISLGHDQTIEVVDYIYSNAGNNQGISINTDGQCPLHIAASRQHIDMIEILCTQFPDTIERTDRMGRTPLLLAAGAQITLAQSPPPRTAVLVGRKNTLQSTEDVRAVETLLRYGADVKARDLKGDTCLHQACAWGNLKTARALVQAGADPLMTNHAGWRADAYSLSVQADVYFRNLVAEFEKRKAEDAVRKRTGRRPPTSGGGAVRLVGNDESDNEEESDDAETDDDKMKRPATGKTRPIGEMSRENTNGLGIRVQKAGDKV